MSARVVSVNVGRPAPLYTGVARRAVGDRQAPVSGPVAARGVNLERRRAGRQAQPRRPRPGGLRLCERGRRVLERAELGRELEPGAFGENLTLAGRRRLRAPGSASAGGSARSSCASPGRACPATSSRRASACPASRRRSCTPAAPAPTSRSPRRASCRRATRCEIVHRPDHDVTVVAGDPGAADRPRAPGRARARASRTCSRSWRGGTGSCRSGRHEPRPAGRHVADRGDLPRTACPAPGRRRSSSCSAARSCSSARRRTSTARPRA